MLSAASPMSACIVAAVATVEVVVAVDCRRRRASDRTVYSQHPSYLRRNNTPTEQPISQD